MAEYRVTTLIDVVNGGDGVLSLREALAAAQAGAGADTITFDAALLTDGKGTIATGSTLVWDGGANNAVTIRGDVDGDGRADITLDAMEAHRVVNVRSGEITMSGLDLTRGVADSNGGGARVAMGAALTFEDGAVTDSVAPGIGGGIVAEGTLVLARSTVSGNRAEYGGGIWASGKATIDGAAILDNAAARYVGGLMLDESGSTVRNTTIAGNTTKAWVGGAYLHHGVTATSVTITGNRAGTGVDGAEILGTLLHSVVVGNGDGSSDIYSHSADLFSNNVLGGVDGSVDGTSNAVGIRPDAVFAAVADGGGLVGANGGPVRTVALLGERWNPALDVGGAGASGVDARGVAAVRARDAGAYEFDGDFPLLATDAAVDASSSLEDAPFERSLPGGLFSGGVGVDHVLDETRMRPRSPLRSMPPAPSSRTSAPWPAVYRKRSSCKTPGRTKRT